MLCLYLVYTITYVLISFTNKYCNRKSEKFENVYFLPKIYNSVTKIPKNPRCFIKVNVINEQSPQNCTMNFFLE